ncbi:MAG: outer membrane protein assembly factor BamA [Akkermansiaceae bacterium]
MRKSLSIVSSLALTFLVLFTGSQNASAQDDLEGKNISSVTVKYRGPETVTRQRILDNMSSKAGQKYTTEKIDEDIRNLVAKGLVEDVDILADPRGGSVRLIVEVETKSNIVGVGFRNNTIFRSKELLKDLDFKPGVPLTDGLILEGKNKILKKYNAFGFPDVVVGYVIQPTNRPGYSDLIYTIAEGQKSIVRKIKFAGNNSIASHTLRNLMKTKQKGIFSFITKSGNIDLDKLEDDRELVLEHYRNKGFLKVSSPGFSRVPVKDGRVDLVLNINEGSKYKVNQVAFGPMKIFKPADLAPALTLTAGKEYSAEKIREDVKTIRAYYGSKGYADASVRPEIKPAGGTNVNVIYRVVEGSFFRVGKVTIEGNNITRDRVIRREIPLKPGDNFNTVDIETTRQRLKNLDYFSQVIVAPSGNPQAGYRDINVNVAEKKTGQLQFGIGFSSIDNIVGYANLEQTNFDIKNPMAFTGGGQRFGMELRMGSETQNFKISLVEPWFLGKRLSLGGELYYKGSQYYSDFYDQLNAGAAIYIRKPLGKRSYIRGEYRLEKVEIDVDSDTPADSLFIAEDGDFVRSTLGLNYVYDSRDALSTPRSGHKLDLGIYYSGLGGDVNTYGLTAQGAKHWNLWWDSILTIEGAVNVADGSDDVPIFERQFLGGARNLRGYEFRDVGPRDAATGEVIGGNTSAYMSAEMTFPIVEKVRFATFFDAGFVNEESFDFSTSDIHTDIGLGLRLNLPFGPLAIDYAIPLSAKDDEADKGGQFNFYINYEF